MIDFFSNIFGYILNFIYSIINNYGVAIILFSILLKLLLLPLSIKQQKTLKKSEKIQKEVKEIQEKYKQNPEKMNQETMALYKRENMNPFSGCFSAIIQIILIFAMFYLIRSPLTYMLKIEDNVIEKVSQYIKEEEGENAIDQTYPQISIIRYANNKEKIEIMGGDNTETINLKDLYINMNFFGLDLSDVPQKNYKNWKVFVIPVLYVISSIISIKITTKMQQKNSDKKENNVKEVKEKEAFDMAGQMNKNMSITMPILAVMVSLVAPLGLALYWLINNILMILERVLINKFLEAKKEDVKNA